MRKEKNICKFVSSTGNTRVFTTNFVYETDTSQMRRTQTNSHNAMCLVTDGTGTLHMNMLRHSLSAGMIFFVFDGIAFNIENPENLQYMYITFSGQRSQELIERFSLSPVHCVFEGNEGLLSFWQNSLGKANDQNLDLISEGVLLYSFSQIVAAPQNKEQHLLTQILKTIDENFTDDDFNLNVASEELGYNPKYISRLFKSSMNISFSEYLKNTRIQHAIFLMEQGITSVKNVALLSGYKDPLYFSNVFKKTIGLSPTDYINK